MIVEAYKNISKALFEGKDALVAFLKEKGGFIDTQSMYGKNKGCDTIYGYDYINDTCTEMYVLGIRLDENEDVDIFLAPIMQTWMTKVDNWDAVMNNEFDDDSEDGYWTPLFYSEVYWAPTLLNILENIEEYE